MQEMKNKALMNDDIQIKINHVGMTFKDNPVSYTHLDVYKRQVVRCVAAIPCITAFWWRSGGFVHSDEPYEHKYA